MSLKLLTHQTPPSFISPNILTIASVLIYGQNIIRQLPTTRFHKQTRTFLVHMTKTLVAFQLAGVPEFDQLMTGGTDRHTNKMENIIIGFMNHNGHKCITLSSSILPENGTAESCTEAVMDTFKEGKELLSSWHSKTENMYPNHPDLLAIIPPSSELNICKLYVGSLMTESCNQAHNQIVSCQKRYELLLWQVNLMTRFAFLNLTVDIILVMYGFEQSQIKCQKHFENFWLISCLRFLHLFVFTWALLHSCIPLRRTVQRHATMQKGVEIICTII